MNQQLPKRIVGIGASAGGLEPCRRLLAGLGSGHGLAFVVVMHLSPNQESHLAEILARATPMRVRQLADDVRPQPDHVYVIAPDKRLRMQDGVVRVESPDETHDQAGAIDSFFSSLARDQGSRGVGVVLSGMSKGGSAGLRDIHTAGGLCLVQDPNTAEFDAMPKSAIETGVADAVLSPEQMADFLRQRSSVPPQPNAYERPADTAPLLLREARARYAPERVAPKQKLDTSRALEQFVLRHYAVPSVAVNRELEILHFFGMTTPFLQQPLGEARMDLLSWVRPYLYAGLRRAVFDALEQDQAVSVSAPGVDGESAAVHVKITAEPVVSHTLPDLFLVSFREVAAAPAGAASGAETLLEQDFEWEVAKLRFELQGTAEQLQLAHEEYRASREELLSLNEELQASNEELQASQRDLRAVNAQLQEANWELAQRNQELRVLSSDLNNLLATAEIPALFLDRALCIRRFTPACRALMCVLDTDVGRPLDQIKIRVQDDTLYGDVAQVLHNLAPVEAEVWDELGNCYVRRVLPYRTPEHGTDGVCVTFLDVSSQKRAIRESEEARRFSESIVRASRTPMLVLDQNFAVLIANPAFFATFEVRPEATLGANIFDLGNRQWDIPRLRTLLEDLLPKHSEIRSYDVEHLFEDIGWRAMRLNASVLTRTDYPDLILVSIEDITDLRNAEAAAQRRADELGRDHRRKDEFLAMLGHELRNPVGALSNAIELLGRMENDSERIEHVRGMMARQTRRMTSMLDQLLDLGRVISGKLDLAREAVPVAHVVRAAVETVESMVEEAGQQLSVALPPQDDMVLVLGDAIRLTQVVENLLVNASKYTPDGGRIDISVEATATHATIAVRDSGCGMDAELLAHAFDLFTQAPRRLDRAKGGLGLGLPLVRSLVGMHGGTVEATSAGSGKGSQLVVTLPRLPSEHRSEMPKKVAERDLPARRVLVVDDEIDSANLLADLLRLRGQDVRTVHDGGDAVRMAREFRPDAVLLDLGLPTMDGYEVAARLRAEHGGAPLLIAITGYKEDRPRLEGAGFNAHVLKPPDMQKLCELLAHHGQESSQAASAISP